MLSGEFVMSVAIQIPNLTQRGEDLQLIRSQLVQVSVIRRIYLAVSRGEERIL